MIRVIAIALFYVLATDASAQLIGAISSSSSSGGSSKMYDTPAAMISDSAKITNGTTVSVQRGVKSVRYSIRSSYSPLTFDSVGVIKVAAGKYAVIDPGQVLTPEAFGGAADFKRSTVSTTNGSAIITCASCGFSSADVGKVVAIKGTRSMPDYTSSLVTMNATIVSVSTSTTAVLDSVMDATISTEMLWGTNNFDPIQKMLDYGDKANCRKVQLSAGTYYVVPRKGKSMRPLLWSYRGAQAKGGFSISGAGVGATVLKFGEEDIMRKNEASIYEWSGLMLVGNGNFSISALTMEAPDRSSTETAPDRIAALVTEFEFEILQNVNIEDVDFKGDWDHIFISSRGGKYIELTDSVVQYNNYTFKRVTWDTRCQGISIFSDTPAKRLFLEDVVSRKSGAKQTFEWPGIVSVTSGRDTLTVNQPGFSWYNFTSSVSGYNRTPLVRVGGSVGSYTAQVLSIISPTKAKVSAAAPSTYTNDTLKVYSQSSAEFHAVYVHPIVAQYWKNVRFYNCEAYGMHIYSTGAQVGKPEAYRFDNFAAYRTDGTRAAATIKHNYINAKPFASGGYVEVLNMLEQEWNNAPFCKTRAINSRLDGSFSDTCDFHACSGLVSLNGAAKLYRLYSCDFRNGIYWRSNGGKFVSNGTTTTYLEVVNKSQATEGFVWNGGGISHIRFLDMPAADWSTSGRFVFENMSYVDYSYPSFYDLPSGTQYADMRKKVSFIDLNTDVDFQFDTLRTCPRGLIPVRDATNFTPVTTTVNPNLDKPNEYESFVKIRVPQNASRHTISVPGTTQVNCIWPSGKAFSSSPLYYRSYMHGLWNLSGKMQFTCTDTFRLTHSGLLRVQYSGPRRSGEVATFRIDPDNGVMIEENVEYKSNAIKPWWPGVNGEVVWNSAATGPLYWQYKIVTAPASHNNVVGTATSVVEFDLPSAPYTGAREMYFIKASTMMSITVPRQGGTTEIFVPTEYGQLLGSLGSKGAVSPAGHIKLTMLVPALGTISVSYNTISSQQWVNIGSK